jgi:alpha-L-fucosidase
MVRKMKRGALLTYSVIVFLVLGLVTAVPARAELLQPRQQWLREATAGLFLHWGMRTAPGYTDCAAWEQAITSGGWDPSYWVDEGIKLHTQYLVLASFHSRLGYARAWPSAIPVAAAPRGTSWASWSTPRRPRDSRSSCT